MKNPRVKIKYVLFLISIFHLSSFIFHLPQARAEGASLSVYPSLIKIKSAPPSEVNANLNVENLSDDPLELQSQIKLFKASENGDIVYLGSEENPNQIRSRIQLFDKNNQISGLTLGPKQKTQLQIKIFLNENDNNTDYYFSVIFLSKPKSYQELTGSDTANRNSFSAIRTGIASNVLLSVGPEQTATASIEEFSSPSYVEKGPLPFTVKIKNNASRYISPKGTIAIKNMFGQLIGKVDIPQQNVLANSSRYLASSNQNSKDLSSPSIVWKESFLLGFYTAELNLQTSPGGPVLIQTTRFTALPFKLILTIALAIPIFLLIRKRVKQKMSD